MEKAESIIADLQLEDEYALTLYHKQQHRVGHSDRDRPLDNQMIKQKIKHRTGGLPKKCNLTCVLENTP